MKRIRYLRIQFDTEIAPFEIPAFRGAVITKTRPEHLMFRNYLNGRDFLCDSPVIQYKRIGRKPALVCVDYGIEEVHHLLTQKNLGFSIGQRPVILSVSNLQMDQYTLQVWKKTFEYGLYNWMTLNQENDLAYQQLTGDLSRTEFLEGVLKANILSFAKGMKWEVSRTISHCTDEIVKSKIVPYK